MELWNRLLFCVAAKNKETEARVKNRRTNLKNCQAFIDINGLQKLHSSSSRVAAKTAAEFLFEIQKQNTRTNNSKQRL